ncbi:hypothetical protein LH462_06815 [Laribacter hongkongensis]|uniref:Uncharacterized protein n=2 Tax=Laribacter hongkongensis TaxID=168471 RepID=A0ABD4SPG9_9NEIS|nr:hypothetical protein [Laribacter hongkongensis]MCG9025178.1 hypothetical protein [Laribacter hongkongensis]MCG9099766.1 hypothetical protein [Laribacter hongkongensis]MCG9103432.1 hypothetical protein [Laribacter hongkongensis]MCG9111244.1 hypothetical protein [Laribacter hongkongensis]
MDTWLQSGRRPVEAVAEWLGQQGITGIELKLWPDGPALRATVAATVGGARREWKLSDMTGVLLDVESIDKVLQALGRYGVEVLTIGGSALDDYRITRVSPVKTHADRLTAERRRLLRLKSDQTVTTAAAADLVTAGRLVADSPDAALRAEVAARQGAVSAYAAWLTPAIAASTRAIELMETSAAPSGGIPPRDRWIEWRFKAGDPWQNGQVIGWLPAKHCIAGWRWEGVEPLADGIDVEFWIGADGDQKTYGRKFAEACTWGDLLQAGELIEGASLLCGNGAAAGLVAATDGYPVRAAFMQAGSRVVPAAGVFRVALVVKFDLDA